MPTTCEICQRGTVFGRNIRHKHSGRWQRRAPKTNREFKTNVHRQTVMLDGRPVRVNICTRCLRTLLKMAV